MKITLLLLVLFIGLKTHSQDKVIETNRYLVINHVENYNIFELYKSNDLVLETKNDTPYLKNNSELIKEGWARYYDYTNQKFISIHNGSKRIYPIKNTYTFTDSMIYDSEYSKFKILSKNKNEYTCLDISGSTKENGKKCQIIVTEKYIFIQYKTHTYIYAT